MSDAALFQAVAPYTLISERQLATLHALSRAVPGRDMRQTRDTGHGTGPARERITTSPRPHAASPERPESYLPLVHAIVRREFWSSAVRHDLYDDYVSEGSIGLLHAARAPGRDPSRPFEPFASVYIRHAIQDFIRAWFHRRAGPPPSLVRLEEGLDAPASTPNPASVAAARVDAAAALARIPPAHARLLHLQFIADYTQAETAALLGQRPCTVLKGTRVALRGARVALEGGRIPRPGRPPALATSRAQRRAARRLSLAA